MFWLRLICSRLYGLLRKNRIEQEMDDEMRFHLLMRTRVNIERGMRPDDAELEALRRFGNVGRIKDLGRDIKGGGFLETLLQDMRYGARMLLKHKGLTAVAVLSLGFGIGVNVAIFSLTEAFLWRGLPAADHDRLFTVIRGDGSGNPLSYPEYLDYRDRNHVFSGIAAIDRAMLAFGAGERSEVVVGEFVTGNYFDVLGVPMAQGRAFSLEEDRTPGASPVTVVSYDFWQRRFGGDPQLVGKNITFNNQSFTVIGITAAGFVGAFVPTRAEVWVPMTMRALGRPGGAPELSDRQAVTRTPTFTSRRSR